MGSKVRVGPRAAAIVAAALLLTAGLFDVAWSAGAPAASNPARLPASADPFPRFDPGSVLQVVPVPATANESLRLVLVSLEGLVNRNGTALYLDFHNETTNASSLLNYVLATYGLTEQVVTVSWALAHYLHVAAGLDVYDPAHPESVNVATTYAGVHDAVVAGPDLAPWLSRTFGLPVLFDYAAEGWSALDPIAALDRSLVELYPRTDPDLLAILPPDHVALRDYLVAARAFVFYEPQGVLASPTELAATERVLAAAPRGIPVIGWFATPTLTEENSFVQLASSYGKSVVGTWDLPDLSVLTAYGRDEAFRAPGGPAPATVLGNDTYVVVAVSDGDNLDFAAEGMRTMWASPERGTMPIAWSLDPVFADLAPPLVDFYFRTASPDDAFIAAPSGAGYVYPGYLGPGDLAPYAASVSRYLNRTGMDTVWLLNAFTASEIPYRPQTLDAFAGIPTLRGLALDYDDQAKTQDLWMQGSVPVIRSTHFWTTEANFLGKFDAARDAWGPGPHFLWLTVYPFKHTLADAAALVADLRARLDGGLQVVAPDAFFSLMDRAFVSRARADVASFASNPVASFVFSAYLTSARTEVSAADADLAAGELGPAAGHGYAASQELEAADLLALVAVLALLVAGVLVAAFVARRDRFILRTAAGSGPPWVAVLPASALLALGLRYVLAENFWTYQWVVAGLPLGLLARPLRRHLDGVYPRAAPVLAAGLAALAFGLTGLTAAGFPVAFLVLLAALDGALVRSALGPRGLVLALALGVAAGFALPVGWPSGLLLAVVLVLAASRLPRVVYEEPDRRTRGAWLAGLSLVLPVGGLALASTYSLGLRIAFAGADLGVLAVAFVALGPLLGIGLDQAGFLAGSRQRASVAWLVAAALAVLLGMTSGTPLSAALWLALLAALAVASAAQLASFHAAGGSLPTALGRALMLLPLLVLFLRMPPVVYSLVLLPLPEPFEYALYAPEWLLAAVVAVAAAVAALRARSTVAAGSAPAL